MCISAAGDSAKSASALSVAAIGRHQRCLTSANSAKSYLQRQHEVGISAVSDSADAVLVCL
jgi:hypothetical protein